MVSPAKSRDLIDKPKPGSGVSGDDYADMIKTIEKMFDSGQMAHSISVRDFVMEVVPLFRQSIHDGRIEELKRAAKVYRPSVEIRSVDTQLMEMQKNAAEAILQGSEWLSAIQVGELAQRSASNPAALANRWKKEGKLFSISWRGKDWYPRYAFDDVIQPRRVIAEVIEVFGTEMDPWRIAAWFESSNAWLGGSKPRDLMNEPERVVAAARRKGGWRHG
ncbi:MAG: hypothetical protein L0H15_08065 [Nitrosospira sp.]|nr:hypothetical protein [Nitrosospira sp.]